LSARRDRDGWIPAALTTEDASYHFRVGPTKWREWVETGVMPQPRVIGGVVLYDTSECEAAFRAIPHRGEKPETAASPADRMRL
jgi:hypothetical protein